jgi:hypothetical protein
VYSSAPRPLVVSLRHENLLHFLENQLRDLLKAQTNILLAFSENYSSWVKQVINVDPLCIDSPTLDTFTKSLESRLADPMLPSLAKKILTAKNPREAATLLAQEDPKNQRIYKTLLEIASTSQVKPETTCGQEPPVQLLTITSTTHPLLVHALLASKASMAPASTFITLTCRQWLELYTHTQTFDPAQVFLLTKPCRIPFDATFTYIFQNSQLTFTNISPKTLAILYEEKPDTILLAQDTDKISRIKLP